MPEVLFDRLTRHGRDRGSEAAVRVVGAGATDYRTLIERIEHRAAEFSRSHAQDDPVSICRSNGLDYVIDFLAGLRAGRPVLPFHPSTTLSERDRTMAEMRFVPAGAGLILRSSGTTGLPKLVHRDGPSLDAVASNTATALGLDHSDRVLAAIPLSHSYGIENGLLAPLWAGATIEICEGFDPAVVLRQWRKGVTVVPGVPFMFEVLAGVGERGDARSLRLAYSAGATLPRSVFEAFVQRHGLPLGQLYGATEIGSVTFNDPRRAGFDPQSVGVPMEGVSIRILHPDHASIDRPLAIGQEGHVAVRAPSMLRGYIASAGEPLLDGYFLTGDLGRLDQLGALTISGRLKLLIDIGGMKVNPLEVESVLAEHPDVHECIVVPVRVSATLVRLKACVTARPGRRIDITLLRQFARDRLAGYKVPRMFEVHERLPRSAMGKIQRQHLQEPART